MIRLSNDEFLAVAALLGVREFPVALAVGPRQDTAEALLDARRVALRGLGAAGVVDEYGDVAADLAAVLRILARPDRQLVARIVGVHGVRRVCVVRRAAEHALVIRDSEALEVSTVWADESPASLARVLCRGLPSCPPAVIAAFGAPSRLLAQRLDEATGSVDFTDIAYGCGVVERDAVEFGRIMASCRMRAEILAYRHEDGVAARSAGAAAVYDSQYGRIIAGPSSTSAGETWSTFAPGSEHRLAQAIAGIIGSLPGGRWMP
ncbi:ESX secretion-associated protein EspG [Nocardia alni]|uniref:ESX secretion-associated protein EspG n=1 Tax=Nocardia alni TaxID=2815723 RepID=UPI001C217A55|nr:ESX secretion-associated protein EspG [Nocardia alni]